jgi:capsular polysaccharide biosynthesis protein
MKTIFYLEGRSGNYLYHFFIYNLGGLYYIINKQYNVRGEQNTSALLEDKSKNVPIPTTQICYPIKIHMKNIIPFQKETFTILKDKFELIEDLSILKYDYEIVSIYGENNEGPNYTIYPFIRNIFLEQMKFEIIKEKRIFITRKNSESYHGGVLKRYMYNENELMLSLKKYNFEYIQLEDLSMYEKIKLFMESEMIVSTHSGALTLLLFANKNTKIIEILNKGTNWFVNSHYKGISKVLHLHYHHYSNINEDYNGNFNLNVNEFENYLIPLL